MIMQGCSSCGAPESSVISPPAATPSKLPFQTKEPQIYQADLIVTTSSAEEKTFVARKNDKYRVDIFQNGEKTLSEIIAGSRSVLDHRQKTYYEEPQGSSPTDSVSPADNFFRGTGFSTFEEIGVEGNIRRYRVRQEGLRDNVTLTFDTSVNMIVAQEFTAEDGSVTVKYEMRDIRLEVADDVFQVPAGYRRVDPPVRR